MSLKPFHGAWPALMTPWFNFGFPGAFRKTRSWLGFDCGRPRLPNLPLPPERREALHAAGFLELTRL